MKRNRNKRRIILSFRLRLVLLVAAELVASVILALWIGDFLNQYLILDWDVPLMLSLIVISLLIGSIVTAFLSRLFFDPTKKLRFAMAKVADGDFSVNLQTRSNAQEIQRFTPALI